MSDHPAGDNFSKYPLDLLDIDPRPIQAEDLPGQYRLLDSRIAWASNKGLSHSNTDPSFSDRSVSEEVSLTYVDGDAPTHLILRKGTSPDPPDQQRGRYGKATPTSLYIDAALHPAKPLEITRVTLQWSGDHDPSVQAYSYSVARIIYRAEDAGAPETLQLTGGQKDDDFVAVMTRVQQLLERPNWEAFIDSAPPAAEPSAHPDSQQEILTNTTEADAAQDVVDDFLQSQNFTPHDLLPDQPARFSVAHLDEFLARRRTQDKPFAPAT